MADLAVQNVAPAGLEPVYVPADGGGDTFENDGRAFLHVKNGSAGAIDVTVDSVKPCNQGFDHDVAVSVPAGGERMIGPFPRERFGSPTSVAYASAPASLTVAALRL